MKLIKNAMILALLLGIGVPRKAATDDCGNDIKIDTKNLEDEVNVFLDKYAKHMVNGDAACLAGLAEDDVIAIVYGLPPVFSKKSYKGFYVKMFEKVDYARLDFTTGGVGEVPADVTIDDVKVDDVVYAWVQGSGYDADGKLTGIADVEFVFKRNSGNLRLLVETKFLHSLTESVPE